MLVSVNIFAAGNSIETATFAPVNGVINGAITVNDDYDYYRLDVTEGGVLTLDASSGSRTEMYLLNESGFNIGHNYNYSEQEMPIIHKVNPGTYYIRLTIWGYTTGSYSINTAFVAGIDDAGDTEDTALLLNENTTANFSFEAPGDVDYFRINLVEKGNLSVKYTGTSEVQFGVTGADTIENFVSGGSATVITSDGILYTSGVIPPGDYYVRLFPHDDTFGVVSYALETTFISVGDDHGDEITSATQVSLGNYSGTVQVQGSIETAYDSDMFRIDLPSKKTVSIFSGGGEYIGGALFDGAGTEIDRDDIITGGYVDFSFTRVLPIGTYYAKAIHYGPADSTPIYTMHFSLLPATSDDFRRDGTADLLVRHEDTGQLYLYEMNGNQRTGSNIGGLSTAWTVNGLGDLGGDGKADILVRRNSDGYLYLYEMDGNSKTGSSIGALNTSLSIVGLGDLGGDGKDDIVLRAETGFLSLYEMDGNSISPSDIGPLSIGWTVEGIGDFGGDGKDDLLIRNSTGQLYLYEMNGNQRTGSNIGGLSLDWDIAGIGDLGGDGKADIVIRHGTSGQLYLYEMNGNQRTGSNIGGLSIGWEVVRIADYSGDGKADIMVRNIDSGQLYLYEMNGNARTGSNVGGLAKAWEVQ